MFRKLIYLCFLIFVLGLISMSSAQDVLIRNPDTTMPVIDGVIDEVWLFSSEQTIGTITAGTAPSSPADCSGTWWSLWNSECLYVLVVVKDESLTNDSGGGDNKWNDDSVEVYIDGDNSKGASIGDNDHQYSFRWNNEELETPSAIHHGAPSLVGVEYAVDTTADGYMLEIKLPWMSIMSKPATPGQRVGIDVWINDDDVSGDRDSQISWHSTDGNGWQNPSVWGVGALVAGNKAANPYPADGALHTETWATLSWLKAASAVSHDVYIGDNLDDVNDATHDSDLYCGNQTTTFFVMGFPGYPFPGGLVPGVTYYWRIDEITAEGTVYKGDVWSFLVPPKIAYNPVPADDAKFVDPKRALNWTAGHGAKLHTVYLGDNFDDVNNATGGTQIGVTTYNPVTLELEKTYYWRVDEFDGSITRKGDVWRFKTAKAGGGVRADYYSDMELRNYVLTRTDPQINFNWADGQPDPTVGADDFSVRWSGEFEAGYTETYTFYARTDDGVRLWVGGKQLADAWESVPIYPIEHSGTIDLVAGNTYSIVMEYFENTDNAVAELRWSSPSTPKQFIPQAALALPVKAGSPSPSNGATGTKMTPILRWGAGDFAASHELYFGMDVDAVVNADKTSPEYKGAKALGDEIYDPGKLAWDTTYYWRVDEVNNLNPDSPWIGNLWSFTTGDFIVVDDFEDYDADENQIWFAWNDGLGAGTLGTPGYIPGNGTGAAVGDGTTGSYTEESIVHSGVQSMPYWYDNNKQGFAYYSEAVKTLSAPRDWSEEGVTELSLWFKGFPGSVGSFVEGPVGTYTMTGSGTDIWNNADEFHYAYKTLTGVGSIVARVQSVSNTNNWAKAGVMIRESLEPGSVHATMVVTPAQGISFQRRNFTDDVSSDTTTGSIVAPYWVKIERDLAGNFTAYSSTNGTTWQIQGAPENIQMGANIYIGLAVTSHDAALTCQAVFSNVKTTGTVGPQWANQDIGILSNDAEPLYVAVSNTSGNPAVVVHDDPAAAQINIWTEWVIPLQMFADQGINLGNVDRIAIGLGTKGNMTIPGGSGKIFIDDIRLYRPREAAE
jgi:hypothetical protein